jgi:GNAT superfamily N-acetyltransferase
VTGSSGRLLPDAVRAARGVVTVSLVPGDDPDAALLRERQQAEIAERYGEPDEGTFHAESSVANVVVREDGVPVAFVAVRDVSGTQDGRGGEHPVGTGEVKRLYVEPAHRGRGHARTAMRTAHESAVEAGLRRLVLESGTLQPESIDLYLSLGYVPTETYGHYAGHPLSRCFALDLPSGVDPGRASDAGPPVPAGRGPTTAVAGAPRVRRGLPARPAEVRAVAWDDPDAWGLRREMHETSSAVLYPELFVGLDAAGGLRAVDARLGEDVVATLVAYRDGEAVGCASLRRPAPGAPPGALEVKKVFVRESARRTGTARALMAALDGAARGHGVGMLLLETGIRQPGAVALYRTLGYRAVLPFPPYDAGNPVSLCFAKRLG